MTDITGMTLEERMEYAARRKREMNCCQAVLVAYADRLGKSEDDLLRLGSGFGSGMGTMEGTCGALVGAILSIAAILIVYFSKDALDGEDWLIETYKDKLPMLAVIPDANSQSKSYRKKYANYGYGSRG